MSLTESGRPWERVWGEASEMTRKRMERDLNTPNSTQTESSSIADTWIVQDRAKGRRMGSVEVERGLSILRSAEGYVSGGISRNETGPGE